MKKILFFLAVVTVLTLSFTSCYMGGVIGDYPIMYIVNGSDYAVEVYCDNHFIAATKAHTNSGKVRLSALPMHAPIYIEVLYYNDKKELVDERTWDNYYFRWSRAYKMIISGRGSAQLTEVYWAYPY